MEDAVEDCVDGVLAEQLGGGAIVLNQVEARLAAVLVVAVPCNETRQPRRVATDPAVHPAHLVGTQARGIGVRRALQLQGDDALEDQFVEPVGRLGAAADVGPGDVRLQAGIAHDRLDDAIERRVRRGQVHLQRGEPAGNIREQGVVVAVLVGETGAVGADREAEVVDAVEHGVDQRAAVEQTDAAVVLDAVETGLLAVFVVPVQRGEQLEALRTGRIAHPGVEGDDVGGREHVLAPGADGPQALHHERVEAIGRDQAGADRTGLVGPSQARVAGNPAEHLIQTGAAVADRGVEGSRVAGERAHGGDGEGRGAGREAQGAGARPIRHADIP